MRGRLMCRRQGKPGRRCDQLLGLHVCLVDAPHRNGIASDGDWYADQAARIKVLDAVECSFEVLAGEFLFGVQRALGGFDKQHGSQEALEEVAGRMKAVPMDSDTLQTARDLGICLGD